MAETLLDGGEVVVGGGFEVFVRALRLCPARIVDLFPDMNGLCAATVQ